MPDGYRIGHRKAIRTSIVGASIVNGDFPTKMLCQGRQRYRVVACSEDKQTYCGYERFNESLATVLAPEKRCAVRPGGLGHTLQLGRYTRISQTSLYLVTVRTDNETRTDRFLGRKQMGNCGGGAGRPRLPKETHDDIAGCYSL